MVICIASRADQATVSHALTALLHMDVHAWTASNLHQVHSTELCRTLLLQSRYKRHRQTRASLPPARAGGCQQSSQIMSIEGTTCHRPHHAWWQSLVASAAHCNHHGQRLPIGSCHADDCIVALQSSSVQPLCPSAASAAAEVMSVPGQPRHVYSAGESDCYMWYISSSGMMKLQKLDLSSSRAQPQEHTCTGQHGLAPSDECAMLPARASKNGPARGQLVAAWDATEHCQAPESQPGDASLASGDDFSWDAVAALRQQLEAMCTHDDHTPPAALSTTPSAAQFQPDAVALHSRPRPAATAPADDLQAELASSEAAGQAGPASAQPRQASSSHEAAHQVKADGSLLQDMAAHTDKDADMQSSDAAPAEAAGHTGTSAASTSCEASRHEHQGTDSEHQISRPPSPAQPSHHVAPSACLAQPQPAYEAGCLSGHGQDPAPSDTAEHSSAEHAAKANAQSGAMHAQGSCPRQAESQAAGVNMLQASTVSCEEVHSISPSDRMHNDNPAANDTNQALGDSNLTADHEAFEITGASSGAPAAAATDAAVATAAVQRTSASGGVAWVVNSFAQQAAHTSMRAPAQHQRRKSGIVSDQAARSARLQQPPSKSSAAVLRRLMRKKPTVRQLLGKASPEPAPTYEARKLMLHLLRFCTAAGASKSFFTGTRAMHWAMQS